MKKRVIFICTHNSARSQMAEGLLKHLCGEKYEVFSAGTKPSKVNPLAIEVLKEIGIDISNNQSKSVKRFIGQPFDYVITVCDSAREECPNFPYGKKFIHRSFFDPSSVEGSYEYKLTAFRRVRDEIKEWLIKTLCRGS